MNEENLIPLNERCKDDATKIRSMGGYARAEAIKRRKTLKEELSLLLEMNGNQNKLCLKILAEALNGSTKAFEIIRDTIGEKPTEKTEFVGELAPLVVRELKNDTHNGNSNTVSATAESEETE